MGSSAATADAILARAARVLRQSTALRSRSAAVQHQSHQLLNRSQHLVAEVGELKSHIQESIVNGFVVARRGRRLCKALRRAATIPSHAEPRIVDLAAYRRRRSPAA
jgi:hypothetical protein